MSWDGNFEACEVDISLWNIYFLYWGVFEGRKSNRCCLFDTEISIELSTMLSPSAIFVYVLRPLRMRRKLVLFIFRCKFIHSSVGCRSWVNAHAFNDDGISCNTRWMIHCWRTFFETDFLPPNVSDFNQSTQRIYRIKISFYMSSNTILQYFFLFTFLKSNRFRVFLVCFVKNSFWIHIKVGHDMLVLNLIW